MEEDRSADSPKANTPLTEEQIIASTVGERRPLNSTIYLAPYDPAWPSLFSRLEKHIYEALGDGILLLEHVGSTSVPGLSAKPIIDMVLVVADSSDESSYVKPLEEKGYTLRIREPDWYEHRLLIPPEVQGSLHVFSDGCEEIEQMLLFRDWLRNHADDRLLYEETKRELAARTWKYTQNYADAKTEVVQEILARARRKKVKIKMESRPYGKTGEQVSALGLGGAFLTGYSFSEGVATVHKALDLGITYFDTSPMYCRGASQAVLGEALEGYKGDYLIATKLGYFAHPSRFHKREALLTQFEENLRLLRRDRVDTLQLHEADSHHWWSTDTSHKGRILPEQDYRFNDAPALQVLRDLRTEGRCRFIGITGNTADNMARVLKNVDVDTLLLAFNYDLIRRSARGVLPEAEKKGVVRLIGAIFQRGLARPQPELLDTPPQWMTPELQKPFRRLYELQKESGLSLASMGVRFMVTQPEIDVIMIGAGKPAEIEECVRAAEKGPLPDDLYQQIEALGVV